MSKQIVVPIQGTKDKVMVITMEGTAHIDPKEVPDYVWDAGCRVLAKSIRKALKNEAIRKEFEEWKAQHEAAVTP